MTGTLLVFAVPDSSSLYPGKTKTFQKDLNHDDAVSISFLSAVHVFLCAMFSASTTCVPGTK